MQNIIAIKNIHIEIEIKSNNINIYISHNYLHFNYKNNLEQICQWILDNAQNNVIQIFTFNKIITIKLIFIIHT